MAVIDIYRDCGYAGEVGAASAATDVSSNILSINLATGRTAWTWAARLYSAMGAPAPIAEPELVNPNPAKATSFVDDWYYRIHIIPAIIDMGNLTSDQYITVEVWNAYFSAKQLTSINTVNGDGLVITGPTPPYTWGALESNLYQLSVLVDGPPVIEGVFTFGWATPTDNGPMSVTGRRVIMMPFIPEAPIRELLEWKTAIMEANDGTEQRYRSRKAPRQSFQLKIPLNHAELQRADNLLYGWLTNRWALPLWTEAQQLNILNNGESTIAIDTRFCDYREGTLVGIWQDARTYTTGEILTKADGLLTLKRPIQGTYSMPWVMPMRIGTLKGKAQRDTNGYSGSLNLTFTVIDNIDLGQTPSAYQFLGYDVCLDETLMTSEKLRDEFTKRVDLVDFQTGVINEFSPWALPKLGRRHAQMVQGLEEIWKQRLWLHRRAGKQRPFWIPTYEDNMRVHQSGLITTGLTVDDDDYRLFAADRVHIAIKRTDDTWAFRTITGVTDIGNGRLVVEVDTALNYDASELERVSFMSLRRLNTDRVELEWNTNRIMEFGVNIIEIAP